MRRCLALFLISFAAAAHTGEVRRALRLQLNGDRLEGLLTYRVPPGPKAELLLAMPRGTEDLLARRVAAQASIDLKLRAAASDEAWIDLPFELTDAEARRTQTNGIEARALISIKLPPGASVIEIAAGEPPLKVTFGAPEDIKLELISGTGKPAVGGLSLRPRPGRPCKIRINAPD